MEHYTNPDLLKVKTMFDEINIKLNWLNDNRDCDKSKIAIDY